MPGEGSLLIDLSLPAPHAMLASNRRRLLPGIFWGLFAVILWAGSFVLTRFGVKTSLNACDITALRFATAALLLFPVVWRKGIPVSSAGWPGIAVLISGIGAPYGLLVALGLQFAPASHAAALIPGSMTIIVAILGLVILKERQPPLRWLGILTILAGSLLIGGFTLARPGNLAESLGHGLFLAAAFLWAGYVIVLRRTGLAPLHATAIVAVGSSILYLPLYALFLPVGIGGAPLFDVAVQAFYQGGMTTIVGLLAFNRAVVLLGATGGAAITALVPVVTLLIAAAFLREAPSSLETIAVLLVCAGVLLVTVTKPSNRKDQQP